MEQLSIFGEEQKQRANGDRNVFSVLGSSIHSTVERADHDFYATDPRALELFLAQEKLAPKVWECACGEGHLSKVLTAHGYNVKSTDLIDRGFGQGGVDFLQFRGSWDGDILTNPPFSLAFDFVKKAVEVVTEGHKVVMLLRLQFLEGKARRVFFDSAPPRRIYVSSDRIACGNPKERSAIAFAWFVWEKGFRGDPVIKWFN